MSQGGLEVEDVYFACVKHGITMSQGPNFYWETDPAKVRDKHLRLAFTSSSQEQLAEVRHCYALNMFEVVGTIVPSSAPLWMWPRPT